jgi:cystathionine gamma-synthase
MFVHPAFLNFVVKRKEKHMKLSTIAVHTGVNKDSAYNSVITPIYQTSTFRFEDIGTTKGYDYTRSGNPTRRALEESIAALEGGAVCTDDCYGGTERLLRTYAEHFGLRVSHVNMRDLAAVRACVTPATRALWIETPSNPLLNVVDIQALSDIAHEHGALSIVDNTFLSPVNQRPFDFGADLIVHSTTKYLNGHSDVVGGAVVSRTPELAEKVKYLSNALGITAAPFDCWLTLRGIKTLIPRMKEHEHNARKVAEYLAVHPLVARVFYPGLAAHPDHALALKQQKGFGGMVSFELKGGREAVNTVLRSTTLFALAESLGGIESLIEHPASMSHASMDPALREKVGLNDRVIRLSVGIEDADDLIADLDAALRSAAAQ